jgi:N-acetylated-alpha-linked acidic dipeptidase
LPITYHIGPGKDKVHLKLAFNWDQKPVHDVIAKMVGTDFPDQWIIRGNHHDAWVNGAADPLSGMVAELEEARALGELAKNGSKPRRTVVYCAWDGEEPALLGSTEWAEDHEKELKEKVVAYINSDGNGRGFIGASGSHTLEPFFNQVIEDVKDPQTGVSVKERRYAKQLVDADKASRAKLLGNKYMKLGALGAGSDYSPFIQHMGIASMDLGYGGEDPGGEYHSIFDSYDLYTRFKDPGFQYGVTLAKTAGRITRRLANADALPFDFNAFYKTLNDYATEVKAMMDNQRVETETQNKMIEENLFAVAKDPKKTYASPEVKQAVPFLNFSELDNSLAQLKTSAEEFQKMYANATTLPVEKLNQLNLLLYKAERSLIDTDGLPRRPWYKHQVYAPGFYTGYGVKTLPGIREAIEQRNWKEAQDNIGIVSKVIEAYNAQVQQAAKVFSKPTF